MESEWTKEAQEFITEYAGIFAMSDMDLGKTSQLRIVLGSQITPYVRSIMMNSTQYV